MQFYSNKHENLEDIESFLESINFEKKIPFESKKVPIVIYSREKISIFIPKDIYEQYYLRIRITSLRMHPEAIVHEIESELCKFK